MQHAHTGWIASIGGLTALVAGVLALDPQLRRHATALASGESTPEIVDFAYRTQQAIFATATFMKDYSVENSALVTFAAGSLVLLLFMLRS